MPAAGKECTYMISNKDKKKTCVNCRYAKEIHIEGMKGLKCEVYSMIIPRHACTNYKEQEHETEGV